MIPACLRLFFVSAMRISPFNSSLIIQVHLAFSRDGWMLYFLQNCSRVSRGSFGLVVLESSSFWAVIWFLSLSIIQGFLYPGTSIVSNDFRCRCSLYSGRPYLSQNQSIFSFSFSIYFLICAKLDSISNNANKYPKWSFCQVQRQWR